MNIVKKIVLPCVLGTLLVSCNQFGPRSNVEAWPSASPETAKISVFTERGQIPAELKIRGIARVQNHYENGSKVPAEAILEGLKQQAHLKNGVGITHITHGIKQTTADIVVLR